MLFVCSIEKHIPYQGPYTVTHRTQWLDKTYLRPGLQRSPAAVFPRAGTVSVSRGPVPGGWRRDGSWRDAQPGQGGSPLWSWHVALAAMWPVPATERRCCISLRSGTVPGGRWSSSRGPSNHSSDCTRRSFAVTYYHQVNFLKWERASNSGTNGNTEYF